ncbi:MAG: tetratricopeptide repeat protein [Xanthobacteraceae bacterium]|nr:tetratricopeptide repeat protein [Xanthobacteraceae bacterium]
MRLRSCLVRSATAAVMATLTIGLGGCQTTTPDISDITGSLGSKAEDNADHASPPAADDAAARYRANPQDADAALGYAQVLRRNGQRQQAVAVLEKATLQHPGDKALLGGYGRALADNGDFQKAFDVLGRAHTPENPDWRILSVQGSSLDLLGRHDEARRYYASALKIAPDEPSVLSNLGVSYLLTRELSKAEEVLRKACDHGTPDPRIRQNLALVLGLEGRFAEAETLVKADLPADKARANVAYLRKMLDRARHEASNAPVGSRADQEPAADPIPDVEPRHGARKRSDAPS